MKPAEVRELEALAGDYAKACAMVAEANARKAESFAALVAFVRSCVPVGTQTELTVPDFLRTPLPPDLDESP